MSRTVTPSKAISNPHVPLHTHHTFGATSLVSVNNINQNKDYRESVIASRHLDSGKNKQMAIERGRKKFLRNKSSEK